MNLNILGSDQYVYKGDGSYIYFLRVGGYVFFFLCNFLHCCEFLWKREYSDENFFKWFLKKRREYICYEILLNLFKEGNILLQYSFDRTCKRWCAKAFDLLLFEKISRAPCGKRNCQSRRETIIGPHVKKIVLWTAILYKSTKHNKALSLCFSFTFGVTDFMITKKSMRQYNYL
jgi:hypothetical protein